MRTQFSWIAAAEWASWYMADSQGFFAANGIKGGLLHGGPNTPAVTQVVAGGGSEIGLAADELEVIHANAEGADYVILAASYQRSPFGYCWLADTPIAKPADLVGKRIGGVQGDQIRIDAVFKINGLPVEYEFVPMSFDPQPLVDGEMDVMTAYVTNQPISLKMQGVETKSETFSEFGLTTYGDVIFAPRAWLEANRDVAVRYFKGLIAGAEANIASPDTVIPLLVDNYGADAELDAEFEAEANLAYIALMTSDFTEANGLLSMDPAYLESSVWPAYEAAGETDLPDIAKLVDTSDPRRRARLTTMSRASPSGSAELGFPRSRSGPRRWRRSSGATRRRGPSTPASAALRAGITWFDTAPLYGSGEAEERLGRGLRSQRQATAADDRDEGRQAGHRGDPTVATSTFDYSRDGTRRVAGGQPRASRRDRVDVVHVHDPDDHLDQALDECVPTLAEMRDEGLADADLGRHDALRDSAPPARRRRPRHRDDRRPADAAGLDGARRARARVPRAGRAAAGRSRLQQRLLARPMPEPGSTTRPRERELVARVAAIAMAERCASFGVSLKAAAMQFPLRQFEPVAAVVVGMASPAEVAGERRAAPARTSPTTLWAALADC